MHLNPGIGIINHNKRRVIMRKFTIFVLVCLVFAIVFYYVGKMNVGNVVNANPQKITFDDLRIGNLKVGMLYEELIRVKGKPQKIEKNESFIDIEYEDGTSIVIFESRVQVIIVNSPSYATTRGLKVGDSKEKALQLYGKPTEGRIEESVWFYTDDKNAYGIIILFDDDIITYIDVHIREM